MLRHACTYLQICVPKFLHAKQQLTTYETGIVQHVLLLIFLRSEVCKGVDDHTKDEVLNDDDDDQEEEGEIVHNTQDKQWLLGRETKTKKAVKAC